MRMIKCNKYSLSFSSRLNTTQSKSYPSEGGYFHEEAILLLRKFYIRENKHGKVLVSNHEIQTSIVLTV